MMDRGTEYILKIGGLIFILATYFLMGHPFAFMPTIIGFMLYLTGWIISIHNDNKQTV